MDTIRSRFITRPLDLAWGWRADSPDCLSSATFESTIPKIVHTMFGLWDGGAPKLAHRFILGGWIRRNPDWRVVLWRRPHLEVFLSENYPHYRELYQSFTRGVQKADFLRYLLVFHHGGAYCDLDLFCRSSLRTLLDRKGPVEALFSTETVLSQEASRLSGERYRIRKGAPEKNHRIANYFFAAKPGHVALKRVLDLVAERSVEKAQEDYDVLYITGPDAMTEAVLSSKEAQVSILTEEEAKKFAVHLERGGWREGKDTSVGEAAQVGQSE